MVAYPASDWSRDFMCWYVVVCGGWYLLPTYLVHLKTRLYYIQAFQCKLSFSEALLPVGEVDQEGQTLVQVARDALSVGVSQCGPGQKFSSIGMLNIQGVQNKVE